MFYHPRRALWFLFMLILLLTAPLGVVAAEKAPAAQVLRVRVEVSPNDPKQREVSLLQEVRRSFESAIGALPDTRLVPDTETPDLLVRVTASPEGQDQFTLATVVLTAIDNNKLMNVFTRRCGENAQRELVEVLEEASSALVIYRTTWLRSGRRSELGALGQQLARELDSQYLDQLREAMALRDSVQRSIRGKASK